MIGKSVGRKEDLRLITGSGQYLDDIVRPDMAYLGVVRSPHSRARIVQISTAAALRMPGILAAMSANELTELERPIPPYVAKRRFRAFDQPVLAKDVVRYVGEPVLIVVADDPRCLADALEEVIVKYEELPAVASIEMAVAGDHRVHEHWPDNIAHVSRAVVGDAQAAMADAEEVVSDRFYHGRSAGMPLEPRGVLAFEDPTTGMLTVISSTQVTYHVREAIAAVLGRSAERLRVIAPDVGGAFGAKAQVYHEEILVPALAIRLRRPVKWTETRSEHFISTCHDREQLHEVKVGFKRDGTIVAIDDRFWADFGAYPVQEDGVTLNTINHLCAPYKVAHYRGECVNLVTNKMFSAAYRGAGRPEAAFVMDRVLDIAARRLNLDPAEIRRRNFIQPAEMPYRPGLTYKDGVPITYDPGDFPSAFDKLLELVGYAEAREQQRASTGIQRIGIGLSCYLHGSALGPYEGANVRVDPSGKIYVYIGCSSQGQGHATTLAQICADELGVPYDDVTVVGADTQVLAYGIGALASCIAANAGPAVARASREVRRKAALVAAEMLEAAPEDIRITAGRLHVIGLPDRAIALSAVAKAAVKAKALRSDPGLNACTYFSPESVTWAFGAQAAVVEVDIETCALRILKYAATHDCGRSINPMIVEGQLHGAITQGLGGAFLEELVYDRTGQLLSGSFMDYAMPRASDMPTFVTAQINHPSIVNDLGVKGMGESGTISPSAVIGNAVEDALLEFGVAVREVPLTPGRIFKLLQAARAPKNTNGAAKPR